MSRGDKQNRRNSEATFPGQWETISVNNFRLEKPVTTRRMIDTVAVAGRRALFKFHAFKTQPRQKLLSEMDGRSREYNHRGLATRRARWNRVRRRARGDERGAHTRGGPGKEAGRKGRRIVYSNEGVNK